MATRYDRVNLYVDAALLKRQAAAWAREVRQKAGASITQPQSAYVRFLIEQDKSKRKKGVRR